MKIAIEVQSDYEGYFERLTQRIVDIAEASGKTAKYSKVVVSAGPWRPVALEIQPIDGSTVSFDYYSALRTGFGSLSQDDLVRASEMLLLK